MTKKCESEAKEGPRRNSQNFENNDKKRSKVYSPMFLFFVIKIYTAYFTYRTLHNSNVASRMCYSVAYPHLQIRGRGEGGLKKNWGGPSAPGLSPGSATVIMYRTKGETL